MSPKSLFPIAALVLFAGCQDVTAPEPVVDVEASFARLPDPPGKIVFAQDMGGSREVMIMNDDGSSLTALTATASAIESHPVLSPDGTQVAYERGGTIWIMTVDGRNQRQLSAGSGYQPAWSPDGAQVAFTHTVAGGSGTHTDIYVANADGSGETGLITGSGSQSMPAFTPSGGVTYVNSDASGTFLAGAGVPNGLLHGFDPEWSPDGTKLAYHANKPYGVGAHTNDQIYVYEVGAKAATRVTFETDPDYHDREPTWSPDGGIAYVHTRDWWNDIEIRRMDRFYFPYLGNPLVDSGQPASPSWGPCVVRRTPIGCAS